MRTMWLRIMATITDTGSSMALVTKLMNFRSVGTT